MVLLYSCRNEQLTEQETYNNSSQFRPTSKTISLEESKHKLVLKTELQKVQDNLQEIKTNASGKTIDYSNGVSIDTDNVTYIESGPTFHTYTFNLVRENAPENAPLENLVLASLPDGSYKELLITYNFTPQEKQDLLLGKGVKTKGKASVIELTKGTYGGVVSNRSMGVVESCSYKTVDMYFSCYTGEHNSDNESEWGGCKWKSEGGYPAQHITTVALVCTASTALGDDGSPGGGDMGSITGLGSGPNEGTPTIPTFVHPKYTPCGKIKAQRRNADFYAKMSLLESNTGLKMETGFIQRNNGNYEYKDNATATETNNSLGLPNSDLSENKNIKGYMHTHVDDFTYYDTTEGANATRLGIKIFSPADVRYFMDMVKNAKDSFNDLGEVYAVMVSSSVNYQIRFTGTEYQIKTFTDAQAEAFRNVYTDLMKDRIGNQKSLEIGFLKFINDNMNVRGVSLYRMNSDGTNTEIRLNDDKTDTTETNCPN
ncbi:hypothetical protein C1634_006935 [Chryseobacterium viscerum]|uniref:Uncharacterized protein n=2 Tax=Chryseobacterium viscerum TaxID=1037377 RepID=A0A316WM31_9FLAO|nr:hypothetical protein C1634_006935 [Chryseobacterium viscerum]